MLQTQREGPLGTNRRTLIQLLLLIFFLTCRKFLAFPNKTHKNTYVKKLNRFQNQILKGQEMPHVYKWPEELKFYLSVPPAWRLNEGDCVRGKQAKTSKLCEHMVKIARYPSVLRKVELHSYSIYSYSDFLMNIFC